MFSPRMFSLTLCAALVVAGGAGVSYGQAAPALTLEEAHELARVGFEAGRFSPLDVLDAEAAFASAQARRDADGQFAHTCSR